MLKPSYTSVALPKLHVVTVYKLLGALFSDFVVWAHKLHRSDETSIDRDDIRSILCHVPPFADRKAGTCTGGDCLAHLF
jgi:hypothetical protein